MSRDYARKPQKSHSTSGARASRKTKKPATPRPKARTSVTRGQQGGLSLRWIFSLAAVGGFIGFIAYLNSLPAPQNGGESAQQPQVEAPAKENETASKDQKKPGFKFYEMLPDSEVVPPEVEEYTPGPGQSDFDYIVQTGSFRTQADAERQRAQIAFQGLRAHVKQIDLDNGKTWYRVNVGPFTSRSQMNSAVDKLVSISIEPLVKKVPKEG